MGHHSSKKVRMAKHLQQKGELRGGGGGGGRPPQNAHRKAACLRASQSLKASSQALKSKKRGGWQAPPMYKQNTHMKATARRSIDGTPFCGSRVTPLLWSNIRFSGNQHCSSHV